MPGIFEDIVNRISAMERTLAEVADAVRAPALPANVTPDEEVWLDGVLSVEEACAFLRIEKSKLFELMRTGEVVSAKDGRRLIARRSCVRYLARHSHPAEQSEAGRRA